MENIREHGRQRAPMYSDDDLMPLLQELHIPTYSSDDYIRPKLSIVEKLINRATDTIDEGTKEALSEDDEIRKNQEIIGSVSCQVTREILNGNDAHTVTIGVLKYLRNFSWEKGLVFTLTAFGITFGDFWLLVRIYANNAVNEPMTAGQREPTSSANKDAYKFQIEANNDFIKSLLNTTEHLIYIVQQLPYFIVQEMFGVGLTKSNRFPIYVYWIMRGAIVAATQIIILSSKGLDQHLVGISYPKEFDKLKSLNQELMLKFSEFEDRASKWRNFPRLDTHSDVVEMMKTVIKPEKDLHPLYHSLTNRKDNLDVLNGKRVLLLISGLNIASEDIANLKHVTIDSERDVIVWIPILKHSISGSDDVQNQLETLQNLMPWYSIHQPSLIEDGAIEAFRLEWDFKDRPILVVLSPKANVLNFNAIFMVRIWQNLPIDSLTRVMERQLWEKETWNLELLINDIDPIIQEWIRDGSYILMYGGDDIDWIRNFIKQSQSVSCNLFVHVEMVYVGNSHNKDRGCKVEDVIMTEKLSHCLPESSRAYFWLRINSMVASKKRFGGINYHRDKLSQEILRFISHKEWALLAKGSTIIGQGPGRIAMTALEDIEKWRTMSLK
ncbi:protein SIEVE ELEMENT OCCLUSION B-like isoform X2 [Silene latifolia]|uniref:protein SIEVE ELEMENT OCCLUSION B-like isoform X2 n=1 Tax=Silene latifolia TaxID=37657 RepID=UPI003D778F10